MCWPVANFLGILFFNLFLVIFTAPAYVVALIGSCFQCVLPRSCKEGYEDCLARVVIITAQTGWRIVLLLCFWVCITVESSSEMVEALKETRASGGAFVLIMNHTSFLDTIMAVALFPICHVGSVRMMVSQHLKKMPFLGTIVTAMQHFSVPFKSDVDGVFEVDKEAMGPVLEKYEQWMLDGNIASWYPEGALNKENPIQLQTFRAGGFGMVTRNDASIWAGVFVGNDVCWPSRAAAGGRPCRISLKHLEICDSSSLLLEKAGLGQAQEKDRNIYLANHAREVMQKQIDDVVREQRASFLQSDESDSSDV